MRLLLEQAVDVNYLPGIFPDTKARYLCDQGACGINAAAGQNLQTPGPGQEPVFGSKRINTQRDHLDLLWWQVFEDGGSRVETRQGIRTQELPNVLLS